MIGNLLFGILVSTLSLGAAQTELEINTTLMNYTYEIQGPTGKPNEISYGTVFLMGIPMPNQPGKGQFVLVTAAHVFEGISGGTATITLREKTDDGRYKVVPYVLPIRKGDEPLWVRHPTADVAIIKASLPDFIGKQSEEIPMLHTGLLADDKIMETYNIHPGDEILCLGFPLQASFSGFPILRSGRISSYPLTPAKDTKVILFDFEVFPGNSGGPVYFVESGRRYGGSIHVGQTIQFVAGIVSQQLAKTVSEEVSGIVSNKQEQLHLAVVVPAHFIKDTLILLDKQLDAGEK